MAVGILGVGLMGSAVAEKFLDNNYKLALWNRTRSKCERLLEKKAFFVENINDFISESDYILIFLKDYLAIQDVFSKVDFNNIKEKNFICLSTISPSESRSLANLIENNGGNYLEAPVLGSVPQIKNKELFVFCAGNEEVYKSLKYLLSIFAGEIYYLGEIGKAAAIKLAFNQLILTLTVSFSLSLSIILKENIDVDLFMNILRKSALYAPTFDKKLKNYLEDSFDNPNFTLENILKDALLIKSLAQEMELNAKFIDSIIEIIKKGIERGDSQKDYSVLFKSVYQK